MLSSTSVLLGRPEEDSNTGPGHGDFGQATQCFHKLTSVTIPSSVIHLGDRAFAECRSLESVSIPDSVAYIGDLAFACSLHSWAKGDEKRQANGRCWQKERHALLVPCGAWREHAGTHCTCPFLEEQPVIQDQDPFNCVVARNPFFIQTNYANCGLVSCPSLYPRARHPSGGLFIADRG